MKKLNINSTEHYVVFKQSLTFEELRSGKQFTEIYEYFISEVISCELRKSAKLCYGMSEEDKESLFEVISCTLRDEITSRYLLNEQDVLNLISDCITNNNESYKLVKYNVIKEPLYFNRYTPSYNPKFFVEIIFELQKNN